ncbi:hypothetical protein SUNI508_03967 [Seiridium unicorne]|uniref:Uncharacterized protein n=1 Tax=Seiridium unicorne TaxID=138068 RepID=A0ABR2V9N4_9PEZI
MSQLFDNVTVIFDSIPDGRSIMSLIYPPSYGKSTKMAWHIAAKFSKHHPSKVTLCVQHEFFDAHRHASYVSSFGIEGQTMKDKVDCLDNDWKPVVGTPIILRYMTYGSFCGLLSEHPNVLKQEVCHIIFDDAHRQSLDKELAWACLTSGTHEYSNCIMPMSCVQTQDYEALTKDVNIQWAVLSSELIRPKTRSRSLLQGVDNAPDEFEEFAKKTLDEIYVRTPHTFAMVFLETALEVCQFAELFKEHKKDIEILLHFPEKQFESFYRANEARGTLLLAVSHFGSRVPVDGVQHVLIGGTRQLMVFDETIAKDVASHVPLTKGEIEFLASHAPQGEAHIYMTKPQYDQAGDGFTSEFQVGSCCEYYLKAMDLFDSKKFFPFPGKPNRSMPLSHFHKSEHIDWAIDQLVTVGMAVLEDKMLVHTTEGRETVRLMYHCQLDFFAARLAVAISKDVDLADHSPQLRKVAAMALLPIALVPGPGGHETLRRRVAYSIAHDYKYQAPGWEVLDSSDVYLSGPNILGDSMTRVILNLEHRQKPNFSSAETGVYFLPFMARNWNRILRLVLGDDVDRCVSDESAIYDFRADDNLRGWTAFCDYVFARCYSAAYIHNLVCIESSVDGKDYKATDICSGLEVLIGQESMVDIRAFIDQQRQSGLRSNQSAWLIYSQVRKSKAGDFIVSDLTMVFNDVMVNIFKSKRIRTWDDLIGSLFKKQIQMENE